jgi:hypothetical protein
MSAVRLPQAQGRCLYHLTYHLRNVSVAMAIRRAACFCAFGSSDVAGFVDRLMRQKFDGRIRVRTQRSGGTQPFAAAFIQADPIQHAVQRARSYSAVAEGVLQSQTAPGFCAGLSASPSAARHARAAQTLSYPHSYPRSEPGLSRQRRGRVRGSSGSPYLRAARSTSHHRHRGCHCPTSTRGKTNCINCAFVISP